jgi:hypothetical protein
VEEEKAYQEAETQSEVPTRNEVFEGTKYPKNYKVLGQDNIYAELIKYAGLELILI